MGRTTQFLTVLGTLGCAAAIGFAMQSTERAKQLYNNGPSKAQTIDKIPAERIDASKAFMKSDAFLNVQSITLTSGELDLSVATPKTDDEVVTAAAPQALTEPEVPEVGLTTTCEMTAQARPIAAAMVNLTLEAACLPNERVTVHHKGMVFSEVTSATGTLDMNVPALSREAVYILAFSNAEGAMAKTTVEDLEDFDRVVLQWKGQTGFEIHALEFGAAYGDEGHIWRDAPGTVASTIVGRGGFTTLHGNPDTPNALMAEVYTFPKAQNQRAGSVNLTVETEVSDTNCGLEIEAKTLQTDGGAAIESRSLTLSVPECDAVGNFLVLNNLLEDLKVAAN